MKQRLTPDEVRALFEQKRWRQELLALTREITVHQNRRCMCIPTREEAKEEARKLEIRHRGQIGNVRITKNGKGPTGTYTVAYTLTETKIEQLFWRRDGSLHCQSKTRRTRAQANRLGAVFARPKGCRPLESCS